MVNKTPTPRSPVLPLGELDATKLRSDERSSECPQPGRAECGKTATLWQELHVVGGKLREGIRRSLFKPREPAAENKLHAVHRAVALLRDLQLCLFPFLGRRALLEEMRPVDEHHHVGILFDGARLAQIRKLRPALVALRRTRKLAEHQHGDLQFLREALQSPRDAGHFFLAVPKASPRGYQLEIIHQ